MQVIIWATLLVGVLTASLPKRQFGLYDILDSIPPNRIVEAKPQIRQDAKRSTIRWGPINLPAANDTESPRNVGPTTFITSMDPMGFTLAQILKKGICSDCTVIGGKTDVTYEDGSRANIATGVYTHHILLFDQNKRPIDFVSFCPGHYDAPVTVRSPFGNGFLGGGVDEFTTYYTTPDGKLDSGYYIKDNAFLLQMEVVNYNNATQPVYLTMDYEYLPGKPAKEAMSTLLTITGCSMRPGFHTTVSKANLTSGDFMVTGDGWIVSARGHLHDGGSQMQLRLNGNEICNSTAVYGGAGSKMKMENKEWDTISEMTVCRDMIPVKRGDYLTMSAIYDTDSHPLRESANNEKMEEMGIFFFSFVSNDTQSDASMNNIMGMSIPS